MANRNTNVKNPMSQPSTDSSPALAAVECRLNGKDATLRVPGHWTLADALRETALLTGLHLGCEHGVCGACTVLLDGEPVRSCLMLAVQASGRELRTVEGLAQPDGALSALQRAFKEHHAVQCGFCTSGLLMTATALLERCRDLDEVEIRAELAGNLCRCTGYEGIVAAVLAAAASSRRS